MSTPAPSLPRRGDGALPVADGGGGGRYTPAPSLPKTWDLDLDSDSTATEWAPAASASATATVDRIVLDVRVGCAVLGARACANAVNFRALWLSGAVKKNRAEHYFAGDRSGGLFEPYANPFR